MNKKKPWHFYVIYLFTWPSDVWCWGTVVLSWLFNVTHKLHWLKGGLWGVIRRDTCLNSLFKYIAVTLGNGGLIKDGHEGDLALIDTDVESHEQWHVEQHQVAQLVVFVQILYGYYVSGANLSMFLLWPFGSLITYLASMGVAKLRGEAWYRGNVLEEAAYASGKVAKLEREVARLRAVIAKQNLRYAELMRGA